MRLQSLPRKEEAVVRRVGALRVSRPWCHDGHVGGLQGQVGGGLVAVGVAAHLPRAVTVVLTAASCGADAVVADAVDVAVVAFAAGVE